MAEETKQPQSSVKAEDASKNNEALGAKLQNLGIDASEAVRNPQQAVNRMSAATTPTAEQKQDDTPDLRVNGKVVTEEEWLRAASENGYDINRLPPNFRPSINTRK